MEYHKSKDTKESAPESICPTREEAAKEDRLHETGEP